MSVKKINVNFTCVTQCSFLKRGLETVSSTLPNFIFRVLLPEMTIFVAELFWSSKCTNANVYTNKALGRSVGNTSSAAPHGQTVYLEATALEPQGLGCWLRLLRVVIDCMMVSSTRGTMPDLCLDFTNLILQKWGS